MMRSLGVGARRRRSTSDGVPPQKIQDHAGRELEARQHEGRIDAALEAVARVGDDAELAAGAARC